MTVAERPAAAAFADAVRTRLEITEGERMPFMDWALKVPEPKVGTLDFGRFPFQKELYQTDALVRDMVVCKATQVGVSAWLLRWVLYWADVRGLTGLYVFPKRKQMYDFSDARIKAAIAVSPYLQTRIVGASVQNKGLKRIGAGHVYFRGSEAEDDLDSVDADVLALDEYDRLVPRNIPVAERRISGESSLGLIRRVGVPSIPGFGVSRLYNLSDKRRWLVTCNKCQHEQPLTWADNVDTERRLRVCAKCRVPLSSGAVATGRWVAEEPDREVRGYHINKLIHPHADVGELVDNAEKPLPEDKTAFWNRDMAEAFAEEEGRLSAEAIAAAMSMGEQAGATADGGHVHPNDQSIITAGIDVASVRALNVRISRHLGGGQKLALYVGLAQSFDEVESLLARFKVNIACIDHEPEYRLARALAEKLPGRVYLANYATRQNDVVVVKEDDRAISVRRVEAIDAMMEAVRAGRNLLPPDAPPDYVRHLMALIRVVEKDDAGRRVVRYESTGPDDYAHAETYDVLAAEVWRWRQQVQGHYDTALYPLEARMEFERSAVSETDDNYRPGRPEVYVE